MFEALENNPTLRERVLGLTAIGAILIGGAAGVDTMLTGGWQIGGDAATAPVVYATATPQQYFDDVSRDLTTTPPRRVQLASQDADVTIDPAQVSGGLDGAGNGAVTPASYAPSPSQRTLEPTPGADAQQQDADQRFNAIEADVQQANAAIASERSTEVAANFKAPS